MRTSPQSGASGREAGLRSSAALASTLLLLGIGYVLLVTAPLVFQRFPSGPLAALAGTSWLPVTAASGLALGGAAAFLFVLARLVRDLEQHPYACLAPVLAVFTAFVLVGLRVKLPMPGLASEHFSTLAMAVAVAGGALLARGGLGSGLMGAALALLPSAVLFATAWAASGSADARVFVQGMEPRMRLFLGLVAASSLAMLGVALVSRASVLRARVRARHTPEPSSLPRPAVREHRAQGEGADAAVWQRLRAEADGLPPPSRLAPPRTMQAQVTTALDSIDLERLTWSGGFPSQERESRGTPRWLVVMLVLTTLGALGAFGQRAYRWHQNGESQAALQADAQRRVDARRAASARAAVAVHAREAEAAAARLEALLAAPAQAVQHETEQPEAVASVATEDEARKARREERARRRKARREQRADAQTP